MVHKSPKYNSKKRTYGSSTVRRSPVRRSPVSSRSRLSSNAGLARWVEAAKKHGYLQKGSFMPLPKKGTVQYNAIKATAKRG